MSRERWIVVRNWEKFQHRDVLRSEDTIPGWIKVYTKLLHNPDFDKLTPLERGWLLTIWVEFASGDGQLTVTMLSRASRERVRTATLEALQHAGFIALTASRPPKQSAGLDKRRKENPPTPLSGNPNSNGVYRCELCAGGLEFKSQGRLDDHLHVVHEHEETTA